MMIRFNLKFAAITAAAAVFSYFLILFLSAGYFNAEIGQLTAGINQKNPKPPIATAVNEDFKLETAAGISIIPAETLRAWVSVYFRDWTQRWEFLVDSDRAGKFLSALARRLDRSPTDARLAVINGRLKEIKPAIPGRELNVEKTLVSIFVALNKGNNSAVAVFEEQEPPISLDKLQALGITSRLGGGQSNFAGSPDPRIHNIKIGSIRFNGIIVAPGEEFSFNNWLDEVTASTGYQAELVIKNQKLIPEYGGGLCQVSTTLFRAALAAGLPILERHAHSLPVRYYNPQGFDATIYPGVSDFRFKNDSPGPILIQSEVTGASLSFEIFGQSDGRRVIIDGPHVYDAQPDGSMKTWLRRIITTADGNQSKNTFYSNYKSPSLFPTVRNPLE